MTPKSAPTPCPVALHPPSRNLPTLDSRPQCGTGIRHLELDLGRYGRSHRRAQNQRENTSSSHSLRHSRTSRGSRGVTDMKRRTQACTHAHKHNHKNTHRQNTRRRIITSMQRSHFGEQGTQPRQCMQAHASRSPQGHQEQTLATHICDQLSGTSHHRLHNGRAWGMLDPRRPPPGAWLSMLSSSRARTPQGKRLSNLR